MKLAIRILTTAVLTLACAICAHAQRARLLTSADGLSSSLINKIYQDSEGYIWIATEYGLNCFDGTSIRAYYHTPGDTTSLNDSYVRTLIENRPGYLLVGTVKGLLEFDRGAETFRRIALYHNGRLIYPHITDMTLLSNGEIWIGTAGYGLFRHRPSSGETTHIDGIADCMEDAFISCIFEDSAHTIWLGTENSGIGRYYPSARKLRIYRKPELPGDKISSVAQDPASGAIYIGSLDGGVACIDGTASSPRALSYPGTGLAVKSLACVAGRCYAGTEGHGAKLVTPSALSDLPLASPLLPCATGKIHQMTTDRDGNVWVGVYQQGMMLIPQQNRLFESYGRISGPANPIGEGCVMAICHTGTHHTWVSCDNEGIYELDGDLRRLRHVSLPSTAMCLLSDSKGRLWAGTFNSGLFLIPSEGSPIPLRGLEGCKIYSLGEDATGRIYIGTFGKGVLRLDPDSGKISEITTKGSLHKDSNKPVDWINNMLVCPDGNIWLAHYGGISCFSPADGSFIKLSHGGNLADGCIGYALALDRDGKIWCGTSAGLYVYNPTSHALMKFTEKEGLPNNVVCGLCEDEGGNMWISTYHGIAKYIMTQNRFMNFDAGDGLQSNEFTHGAFCKDDTGDIYFGGVSGFSMFYPYDIDDSPRQYSPRLTRLTLFSQPVTTATLSGGIPVIKDVLDRAGEVSLSHTDNTFSLHFSTLTFDNPDKIVFEYRIREHGDTWLRTMPGQNHVTLNNMSPGKYHFQLRVAGDNSPDGTRSLVIEIRPPWYQTWWAMAVYALIFVLVILAAIRLMNMKDAQRREREERRRSEQILEAKLQFFTNISHEIRTPMTLILNPLDKLLEKCQDPNLRSVYSIIYRNAQRILSLVNQLMDMRKLEKGQMKMKMAQTDMVSFVNNAMLPFEYLARQKRIQFRFSHPEPPVSAWIDAGNFDKVLLNIFSNAFKYTPDGGEINVSLTEVHNPSIPAPLNDSVEIRISDTGIGIAPDKLEKIFERFYRIDNDITGSTAGTGIGLHLCRSLVELHHGTITARNNTPSKGCEFIIRIPAGRSHLSTEEIADAGIPRMPRHASPDIDWGASAAPPSMQKPRSKQVVAIVEDDTEIRNFLTSELSEDYKVTTFGNGDDALKAILSTDAPDIIISDVMMPGLDGYALCQKVKQNVNVNHIPVILISARTDDKDRMMGLEAGADSYLPKPFNTDVLKSTIASLLANRNILKAKFSGVQQQEENVRKISLKSHDELLLQKIMNVINDNISSPDFSVERLATEVGLSRVHLHRKLKELTNLSARDFIKSIRMRQAARLLREKKLSVAEVAYATGFANPSHFSNSFKEMYGVPPTAYVHNTAASGADDGSETGMKDPRADI